MSPTVKEEALEQLKLDIAFGFDNEEEVFDGIREMFYDDEDFDEDWGIKRVTRLMMKQGKKPFWKFW